MSDGEELPDEEEMPDEKELPDGEDESEAGLMAPVKRVEPEAPRDP